MQKLSDLIQPKLFENSRKIEEFTAVCEEMQKALGMVSKTDKARIWSMPYKPWFTESKAWRALDIMGKRGKVSVGYLVGIIKKLN